MVVRQQLGSIAEEVVGKLEFAANSSVSVSVRPSATAGVAEDAFVEALQHRGYRAYVRPTADSAGFGLHLSVLTDGAQFREIGTSAFERTVRTELEARAERSDGEVIAVLGIFRRAYSDTVTAKDAQNLVPRQGAGGGEDATLFERFIGPLIVLASGIMIVYLFFTVRS